MADKPYRQYPPRVRTGPPLLCRLGLHRWETQETRDEVRGRQGMLVKATSWQRCARPGCKYHPWTSYDPGDDVYLLPPRSPVAPLRCVLP